MAVFVATYTYTAGSAGRQASLRPERYRYFQQLEDRGVLLASGQLLDAGLGDGLLVLAASDPDAAADLLDGDPFVTGGLVEKRTITGWNPTTGSWTHA